MFINTVRRLLVLALLCAALSTQTHAQNEQQGAPGPAQPPGQTGQRTTPGERDRQILPLLDLSPEQRAQLVAIAEQHRTEQQAALLHLREVRKALNQAIYAENPDQNLVNERAHDVAAAQEALIRLNAQTELKVRQVLTPEQLRRFRQLRRRQRDAQHMLQGQPDDNPRRRLRDRFPNANRPPVAQPADNSNSAPTDLTRARRPRRRP
ncbi:MAG TPA: periplasmic heavy metal sensor [Pyrinomonadaceae bacterium]|jgi:Spy/CpxP family protein refolding chaperone